MLGCGLAFPDEAIVYLGGGDRPQFAHCDSAQRARDMLAHTHDTRLIWIDAGPTTEDH